LLSNPYITGFSSLTPKGVGVQAASDSHREAGMKDKNNKLPHIQPSDYGWKGLHRLNPAAKYGTMIIGEALRDAGTASEDAVNDSETALIMGCTYGHMDAIASMIEESELYGEQGVNPGIFPNTVINVIGGHASVYFQIRGPSITISQGSLSSFKTLLYAQDLLRQGQARKVIVCMINVVPPGSFHQHVSTSPNYESITVFVLDNQPPDDKQPIRLSIDKRLSCVKGHICTASHNVDPCDVPYHLIINADKLRREKRGNSCCTVEAGGEGSYSMRLLCE
jgi:hypothetical protein